MGNRLSKIYTRTGDDGSTGLADGNRIAKNAQRVEAMGTADELNCHIGLLIETLDSDDELVESLRRIQHLTTGCLVTAVCIWFSSIVCPFTAQNRAFTPILRHTA